MTRWWALLILGLLACGVPALADGDAEPADPAEDAVREGLAAEKRIAEVGRRIAALERDYASAAEGEWIPKAILLVELADLEDRRAVTGLARALSDEEGMVVAFALHGLARQSDEDIRQGGGRLLAEGLIEHVGARNPFLRDRSQGLLRVLTGQSLGRKPRKWKKWLGKNGDSLVVTPAALPFDPAGHDAELVAKLRAEGDTGATSVRPRIPSVTSQLRELNDRGIDIVFCLDQTGSMGAVLDEAKQNLELLVGVIEQVVEDHRIGLVTYHDAAAARVELSPRLGKLRETLQRVSPAGGGDMPEGVDKALDVALTPAFGWRKRSVKTVVIVGDAPMHQPDVQPTMQRVATMYDKLGMRFNTVSTGADLVPELEELAKQGGGTALKLEQTNQLVSEVLLLIFGEPMRPAMERFVPVLLEVLQAARGS